MAIDKQKFAKQLGETIAKYRQREGLTQEQLSEKLGIGNEAISRIERGVAMPALVRLIEFADEFKCNVADLLIQSSPRNQDEVYYLLDLLKDISEDDKLFVLKSMENMIAYLKSKNNS